MLVKCIVLQTDDPLAPVGLCCLHVVFQTLCTQQVLCQIQAQRPELTSGRRYLHDFCKLIALYQQYLAGMENTMFIPNKKNPGFLPVYV